MRFAICDDDLDDMARLRKLIEKYGQVHHMECFISEYASGTELLTAIRNGNHADIIFLDINMDGMDGLSVARKIRELPSDVPIVLVTAFISYAIDGYKVKASRFLIKDDLDKTFKECMDDICRELRRQNKVMTFRCVEGEIRLKLPDIIMIETQRHKNVIWLAGLAYHIYEKLDALEEKLKEHGFLRVHNSYLVNMEHIRSISSYILTLDNGEQLSVPKSRYKQVKQEFAWFVGNEL